MFACFSTRLAARPEWLPLVLDAAMSENSTAIRRQTLRVTPATDPLAHQPRDVDRARYGGADALTQDADNQRRSEARGALQILTTSVENVGVQRPRTAETMDKRSRENTSGAKARPVSKASGACGRKVVEVQILSSAPLLNTL